MFYFNMNCIEGIELLAVLTNRGYMPTNQKVCGSWGILQMEIITTIPFFQLDPLNFIYYNYICLIQNV